MQTTHNPVLPLGKKLPLLKSSEVSLVATNEDSSPVIRLLGFGSFINVAHLGPWGVSGVIQYRAFSSVVSDDL